MTVNSYRKEFAPKGANSFLYEKTSFWKVFVNKERIQEDTKVVSFCISGWKTLGLPKLLEKGIRM